MKDKVSIIIPCYNIEKYIWRCLTSIEKQTYGMDNLEILLINDASTDNTKSLLEFFKQKYPRNVGLIDLKHNKGVSYCRNMGMDIASGKYIAFIDGDDLIAENMLEKMVEKANEYDCELVECGFKLIKDEKSAFLERRGEDIFRNLEDVIERRKYITALPGQGVWAKLFNAHFLKSSKVKFIEGWKYSEDILFNGQIMMVLKRNYLINETLYFYYLNESGASHTTCYVKNKVYQDAEVGAKLMELYRNMQIYEVVMNQYKNELAWYIIVGSFFMPMRAIYGEIDFYKSQLLSSFPEINSNKYLQQLNIDVNDYRTCIKDSK